MKSLKDKMKNKKGFTLMEMLIVVAIMVVLVAVAIPTFSNSLQKAKETADDANLRAARSVAVTAAMLAQAGETEIGVAKNYYYDVTTGAFSSDKPAEGYGKAKDNENYIIQVSEFGNGTATVGWVPFGS